MSNKAKTPIKVTEPPSKDGFRVLKKSVTQLGNAIKILEEFSKEYTAFASSSLIAENDRNFVADTMAKGEQANQILQGLKEDAENRVRAFEAAKVKVKAPTTPVANNNTSKIAAAIVAGLTGVHANGSATTQKTPAKSDENAVKRTRRVYTAFEELCFKQFVAKHPTKSPGDIHLFKAFLYTEKMSEENRKGLESLEDNQIRNKLESVRAAK